MLENARCRSQQLHKRHNNSSGNLFTRIDNLMSTTREIKTSKLSSRGARGFPHLTKNQTLNNSKETINYANYLQKVQSALKIDEKGTVSKYLCSLRKEYDKMVKSIKQQQSQINVMNKDIQFMRNRSKAQGSFFQGIKEKVIEKKKALAEIMGKQDEAKMETKVLQNIISRMKHDHLKNRQDNRIREGDAKEQAKSLKGKEDEVLQWDEAIHKMVAKATEMKNQFIKGMQERLLKLHDFSSRVEDLQEHERFEMERKERTYELLSMESNDIMDAKNIVLRDVLMTNKVLDNLLEGKINDLLTHYQHLQNCYHIIKNQTNISDPSSLNKKFFSYTQCLEEITSTITFYEKRQEQLLRRNEQLKQIKKEKVTKQLEDEKNLFEQLAEYDLQKQEAGKQILEKELGYRKLTSWIKKYLSVFQLGEERQNQGQNFDKICEYLLSESQKFQNHTLGEMKFQSPGVRFKKMVKELSIQEEKLRRSQAQEVNETNIYENMYLSHERKKVKKNQFMIKTQNFRGKNP